MAYALAIEGREGQSTGGAARGTVLHEIFSRYVTHLWKTQRQTDWEACAWIAMQVCAEHPQLTFAQRKDVAEQSKNIGQGFPFEPAHYYGSEEALETDLELADGRVVRITGRLDLLEVSLPEGWARITDAKSNHAIPADSAVRDDFQLLTYAMLALDNLPPAVEQVKGQLWLTRYNIRVPQRSEAVWTREDIETFREHLRVRLAAFLDGKLAREFVPGSHCQYCPRRRPGDCTLWRFSEVGGPITTPSQAVRVGARVAVYQQRLDALKTALKAYVQEHGPVRIGSTAKAETFAFWTEEHTAYDALCLMAALELLRDQVGEQPLSELLTVNKQSKAFKSLMKIPDFREAMADGIVTTTQTRFRHKKPGGED